MERWRKRARYTLKESLGTEEEVVIERAHRVKTDKINKRTIVWKILNYKDKVKILRNAKKLKGKNIFINEDFWQITLDHRKELWKDVERLREEGKIAYLKYRSIVVKTKDNYRAQLVGGGGEASPVLF